MTRARTEDELISAISDMRRRIQRHDAAMESLDAKRRDMVAQLELMQAEAARRGVPLRRFMSLQ